MIRVIIIALFVVVISGCGGGEKLEIMVGSIHPESGSLATLRRADVYGAWGKDILPVVNNHSLDAIVIYRDKYHTPEHWVVVFRPEDKGIIGNNSFAAIWGIYQSKEVIFKIKEIELPIETNWLFVDYVVPHDQRISTGEIVEIAMHGLPSSNEGKDVRAQIISFPSGDKTDLSLKNGLLALNGEKISFTMPNFTDNEVWVMLDVEGHETDNFIKFTR